MDAVVTKPGRICATGSSDCQVIGAHGILCTAADVLCIISRPFVIDAPIPTGAKFHVETAIGCCANGGCPASN